MSERPDEAATVNSAPEIERYAHLPLLRKHPRLRFIEGEPAGAAGEQPPAETPPVETPPAAEEPAPGEEALGDAGKKALDAMKERVKAAEKAAREAKDELAKRDAAAALAGKPPEEQALEAARREATEAATKAANLRLVKSELKGAAAVKLSNPLDALAFIDVSQFEVDADGNVDAGALNEAITNLLIEKPYLALGKPPLFTGTGDGGATPPPKPLATNEERAAKALAAGDVETSIALKMSALQPPKV